MLARTARETLIVFLLTTTLLLLAATVGLPGKPEAPAQAFAEAEEPY